MSLLHAMRLTSIHYKMIGICFMLIIINVNCISAHTKVTQLMIFRMGVFGNICSAGGCGLRVLFAVLRSGEYSYTIS